MANEHIGRLSQIGLGKESVAGTAVAVTNWIPKSQGVYLPKFDIKVDPAGYGTIDENKQGQTMRAWAELDISGEPRGKWFGLILNALFGNATPCVKYTLGSIVGTYTVGETVTESTTNATGLVIRNDQAAGTPALYLSIVSGTFGTGHTLTGGTSGATSTGTLVETVASNVRFHVFTENQTNNPDTYTIYHHSPVDEDRSAYGVLNTLDIEAVSNDWVKFSSKWIAKALASTSAQTPTYTSEDPFFGKNVTVKTASVFNSLDAASAINVEYFKLSFNKNVEPFQAFGGTALTSIHNKQFSVKGQLRLLYNAQTQRDYLTNSTDQALRITIANSAVTIGSASSPTIQFDFPDVFFTNITFDTANNNLIRQTLDFTATYDVTRTETVEALLINTQTSTY